MEAPFSDKARKIFSKPKSAHKVIDAILKHKGDRNEIKITFDDKRSVMLSQVGKAKR